MTPLDPTAIPEVIARMCEAVLAERDAVKKALGALGSMPALEVVDGHRIHAEPGAYQYRFDCPATDSLPEGVFGLPEGTRATLETPGDLTSGEILDHDPDTGEILLVLRDNLGERVPRGLLGFDTTFLLDRLAHRLQAIGQLGGVPGEARWNTNLALRLISGLSEVKPSVAIRREGLTEDQASAVSFVAGQDVAYLWGPPGTGKTRTVAHLVHELAGRGEKVLLVAHTNVATDTALLRTLQLRPMAEESVVRIGHQGEELRRYGVTLDGVVDRVLRREHPDVVTEIEEVSAEVIRDEKRPHAWERLTLGQRLRIVRDLLRAREGDSEIAARVADTAEKVREIERGVIGRASVVSATLTRLFTDSRLESSRSDALIVDEASIAGKTLAFVAACCARRRAIAVGDFMQLPAIVQATLPIARMWLGQHVFAGAGCDRAEAGHPLRAMLQEQWRMHPQISRVVSRVFYAGKLRDSAEVVARADAGPAMLLLDTSRTPARTTHTASGSKQNAEHARIVADLVRRAGQRQIAVITPYRAQVRAIRDAVRQVNPDALRHGRVEVFTVHRYQGRDQEMVIFDTCEAPGSKANFLSELHNADAPNLVNVAMSRAKERLILVCHTAHLSAMLGRQSLICRVMTQCSAAGAWERISGDAGDEADVDRFLGA